MQPSLKTITPLGLSVPIIISLLTKCLTVRSESLRSISTIELCHGGNADCSKHIWNHAESKLDTGDRNSTEDNSQRYQPHQCSLYLAPSSIPNAGFGVYTGRDLKEGEDVLSSVESPVIPICDEYENFMHEEDSNFPDYSWVSRSYDWYNFISSSVSTVLMSAHLYFSPNYL